MQEAMLDKAICSLGSVKHMAKKLGIHREHVYAWIKGVSKIPLEYALQIEYLTGGEIHWKDLVPFHIVQRLKHLTLQLPKFDLPPCELVYVALERITTEKNTSYISQNDKLISLHKYRSICVDEQNTLIFGEKTFYLYKYHNKKTIPSWRISLIELANGHYSNELFIKNFLISERVAIGIALEKFLGSRQGFRTDLAVLKKSLHSREKDSKKTRLMNKAAQVTLQKRMTLRQLIANRLGFGSHFTYQNAKKIKLSADAELIEKVDQQIISISKAKKLSSVLSEKKYCQKEID